MTDQGRIYNRIQPGLASMGVKDQASMAAARILADAEQAAVGKVDMAKKALEAALAEQDGVRALIRAAAGDGATMRTNAALMDQLRGGPRPQARMMAGDDGTTERPWVHVADLTLTQGVADQACPSTLVHPAHTWRFVDSSKVWSCPGRTSVDPVKPEPCGRTDTHAVHPWHLSTPAPSGGFVRVEYTCPGTPS